MKGCTDYKCLLRRGTLIQGVHFLEGGVVNEIIAVLSFFIVSYLNHKSGLGGKYFEHIVLCIFMSFFLHAYCGSISSPAVT